MFSFAATRRISNEDFMTQFRISAMLEDRFDRRIVEGKSPPFVTVLTSSRTEASFGGFGYSVEPGLISY